MGPETGAAPGPLGEAWRTIVPARGNPHGPLPPLLLLLTVVTGLVDAYSYLQLGHVFVANMTGNVVFLAFALGGTAGFIWWASILAIATFSAGAFIGGLIRTAHGAHRGKHLLVASTVQCVFFAAALLVALTVSSPYADWVIAVQIGLLGVGMGVQNATARALAVPDLTTTVLTLTITGISADSTAAGGTSSRFGRRFVSIASMFVGALAGTLLVHAGLIPLVLASAVVLVLTVIVISSAQRRSAGGWATPPAKG
ncbi:MAG: YoaK family protein [Herbiconiux sp.]|nr:YoaK family protein [Herbiconiux sp.]